MLVFKGKAEVLEEHETPLHSATDTFARPHVIRLVQYVRVPQPDKRKISRRALFARDGWSCVYCGTAGGRLTLDHVVPRSRGGDSNWENVVTACAPCNLRKGDRLPEEVSMAMRRLPRAALADALHPPRRSVGAADDLEPVPAGPQPRRDRRRVVSETAGLRDCCDVRPPGGV